MDMSSRSRTYIRTKGNLVILLDHSPFLKVAHAQGED